MKNNLTYRVTILEKNYSDLDVKIERIMSNELPHINTAIGEINEKIKAIGDKIVYATLFNVGAIILGLIVSRSL